MAKLKKRFSKAEKLEIVKQSLEDDVTVKSLAERYDVREQTIYRWRSTYIKHKEDSFPGKGNKTMSESERELAALKKENRELKLERDILKKAVGIFAKTDKKNLNS